MDTATGDMGAMDTVMTIIQVRQGENLTKGSPCFFTCAYLLDEVNQRIKRATKNDLAVISIALLQSKYFQGMGIVTTIRRLRL